MVVVPAAGALTAASVIAADVAGAEVPKSLLIACIVALAGVIAYLFRDLRKTLSDERANSAKLESDRATERINWATERSKFEAEKDRFAEELRADHETKFRELVQRYDEIAARDRAANRVHEDAMRKDFIDSIDTMRKEFAESLEGIAAKAETASTATVTMLDKLMDRFVSPRQRGR